MLNSWFHCLFSSPNTGIKERKKILGCHVACVGEMRGTIAESDGSLTASVV
jgi:hypothetical protein